MRPALPACRRGFTLIELLTVIAVIAILAAILIPVVSNVQKSARATQTRTRFSQWANAIQLFQAEYGFFPDVVDASNRLDSADFIRNLAVTEPSGAALVAPAGYPNTKRIRFYSVSPDEVTKPTDTPANSLIDGFGNSSIVVLIDRNNDGIIDFDSSDFPAVVSSPPQVVSANTGSSLTPPTSKVDITNGIRAKVLFYSAGTGTDASDIVYSW